MIIRSRKKQGELQGKRECPGVSKFKAKVLLIFILISSVPLLVISFGNLYLVIHSRESEIVDQQKLAMENASTKIGKYLQEKFDGLNLVISASMKSVSDLHVNDLDFLLLNSFNVSAPLSLDFINPEGEIVARINKERQAQYAKDFILKHSSSTLFYKNLDQEKVLRSAIRGISALEANVAKSPDFLEAIKGENYFGPLEFSDSKPVVRLATQIRNQSGDIIGVVSAEVSLSDMDTIINEVILGEEGYLYVLDKDGRVLASGNRRIANIGMSLLDIPFVREAMNNVIEEYEFVTYHNALDKKVVFSDLEIKDIGWRIFSEWPITDAFSVISNLLGLSIAITVVSLILVIILAIILSGQIVKPINKLIKGAQEISKGNFDHKMNLKTNDEFMILNDKFNEMIEVLKENQKLKDEFVFIAAHELRTPVTAIKGYVSMILEDSFGEVPEKIRENLMVVNSSNDRLVQLVQDLLQVARSDAGKMKVEMTELDIVKNIKHVIQEIKSLADKKGIELVYTEENSIQVQADTYKLKEVLINIIGNAIKYTLDNGSIEIEHEEKDGMLITKIKDHGMGMTQEEVNNLFQKFYRVQNSDTAKIEGTGLGLFICKEIIERMGGKIWVESKKGEGSVFSFSLKVVRILK